MVQVVGIIGYDVFRRAVVEVGPRPPRGAAQLLRLHDCATWQPPAGLRRRWQPLVMVANLPHVTATIVTAPGAPPRSELFLLDSGGVCRQHNRTSNCCCVPVGRVLANTSLLGMPFF